MEKQVQVKHYSILSDILFYFFYFKERDPLVLWFSAAEILFGVFVPLVGIYLPKIAVDLVTGGVTVGRAVAVLGGFTVLMVLVRTAPTVLNMGKYNYVNGARPSFLGFLFLKSLRIKYEYTENREMRRIYMRACDNFSGGDMSSPYLAVSGVVDFLTHGICFFLYSAVIGTLNIWFLFLIIIFSFVNYGVGMYSVRFYDRIRDEQARAERHYYYVRRAMGDAKAGKDIRIFNMKHWLVRQRDLALEEIRGLQRKRNRVASVKEKVEFLIAALQNIVAYGFLIYQVTKGVISVSDFVLYFGAISGFSSFVTGIMNQIQVFRDMANRTDPVRTYLDLPEEDKTSGSRETAELPVPFSIEFRDVSFSYHCCEEDGMEGERGAAEDKEVFHKLNLKIEAGEKLALVGENGAGKTTLVKLLCGMYDPDEGQILINGIDRSEFSKMDYYRLFSVVFQEQLILPFTIGENLAMDRAERIDEKRAWDVLEKAGLKEIFEKKKIGLKTYMTKVLMRDGIEFSGGQQQRFLLARALYKDGPVLVLDEPTAALDPLAESEVYDNYNHYSGGKTAIFISHRMASTKFSDRIVMLEGGEIIEMGTHEELMERNGKYAEMFRVQSSYYDKG